MTKKKIIKLFAILAAVFLGSLEMGWRFFNMVVCCKRGEQKKERKKWFELSHIRENHPQNGYAREYNESKAWCFEPVSYTHLKITQASRDGGVDAVAFDPDPIRGGKIVIQAKRYTNVVGVSAVRDLYGTVMNEGATKGILVTTSNYGNDAYEFAKGKPLTLMNGANLLYLLEKHGHKAKIDLQEAKELNSQNQN